jgi:hypothetical protein
VLWLAPFRTSRVLSALALLPARSGSVPAGTGGAGGTSADDTVYEIDRFIGGIDRLLVAKRDHRSDYCIALTLAHPGRAAADLVLPAAWELEGLSVADAAKRAGARSGFRTASKSPAASHSRASARRAGRATWTWTSWWT